MYRLTDFILFSAVVVSLLLLDRLSHIEGVHIQVIGFRRVNGSCFSYDLDVIKGSQKQCGRKCLKSDACVGFVYLQPMLGPARAKPCFLKKKLCPHAEERPGLTSSTYFRIPEVKGYKLTEGDCAGHDLKETSSNNSRDGCGMECTLRNLCKGFVYAVPDDKEFKHFPCFLKTVMCEAPVRVKGLYMSAYAKMPPNITKEEKLEPGTIQVILHRDKRNEKITINEESQVDTAEGESVEEEGEEEEEIDVHVHEEPLHDDLDYEEESSGDSDNEERTIKEHIAVKLKEALATTPASAVTKEVTEKPLKVEIKMAAPAEEDDEDDVTEKPEEPTPEPTEPPIKMLIKIKEKHVGKPNSAGLIPIAGYAMGLGDCPGHNINKFQNTLQECSEQCDLTFGCEGFVYFTPSESIKDQCVIKKQMCTRPNKVYGVQVTTYLKIDLRVNGYSRKRGECLGFDLGYDPVDGTRKECGEKCDSTEECFGFLYIVHSSKKFPHKPCHLKREMCETPKPIQGLEIQAYFKKVVQLPGYTRSEGNCENGDLWKVQSSLKACSKFCDARGRCVGFIYIEPDTRSFPHPHCHLKDSMCEDPNRVPGLHISAFYKKNAPVVQTKVEISTGKKAKSDADPEVEPEEVEEDFQFESKNKRIHIMGTEDKAVSTTPSEDLIEHLVLINTEVDAKAKAKLDKQDNYVQDDTMNIRVIPVGNGTKHEIKSEDKSTLSRKSRRAQSSLFKQKFVINPKPKVKVEYSETGSEDVFELTEGDMANGTNISDITAGNFEEILSQIVIKPNKKNPNASETVVEIAGEKQGTKSPPVPTSEKPAKVSAARANKVPIDMYLKEFDGAINDVAEDDIGKAIFGYTHKTGACRGDDLYQLNSGVEECHEECDKLDECFGFMIVVSQGKLFLHPPCFLKTKLCKEPTLEEGIVAHIYYKNPTEEVEDTMTTANNTMIGITDMPLNESAIYDVVVTDRNVKVVVKGAVTVPPSTTMSQAVADENERVARLDDFGGSEIPGYIKTDGNCRGNDIRRRMASLEDCSEECDASSECMGYVYASSKEQVLPQDPPCMLKYQLCKKPQKEEGQEFATYAKIKIEVAGYIRLEGDCIDHTFNKLTLTRNKCGAKCDSLANCMGFLFIVANGIKFKKPPCHLKSEMCETPTKLPGLDISAYFKNEIEVPGFMFQDGNCPGSDIVPHRELSRFDCGQECNDTIACTGFLYIISDGRRFPHPPCHLKQDMCETPNRIVGLMVTAYTKIKPIVYKIPQDELGNTD